LFHIGNPLNVLGPEFFWRKIVNLLPEFIQVLKERCA